MKFRNGFVSNSSSSSYIIYGFMSEDLPEEIGEQFDEVKNDSQEWWDYVYGEDQDIVGACVAYWSDGTEEIDEIDTRPETLAKYRSEIRKLFRDRFGYEVPEEWFKLFATTYYS